MEAMERRGKVLALAAIVLIVFWSQCKGVEGHKNSTKMSYVCPPHFIRLGHSCYYFSENKATWQNALFACKDRDSNLTVPARWEDRNLRQHLNQPNVEKATRWIGGIYDYSARSWKWGGELRKMRYQSFSKMKKMAPEELQWHCIAMKPELLYRWAPQSCIEHHQYICQTKLRKVPKSSLKDLKRRWQRMGAINEITVPSASREANDPANNDVTSNPLTHPKSYDLRPSPLRRRPNSKRSNIIPGLRLNEMKKRSKGLLVSRKLSRPFPGYSWNRLDPIGSYQRNAAILYSGKTGLTAQQVKVHLARLTHMRDKQLRKKPRHHGDWLMNDTPNNIMKISHGKRPLVRVHGRTYTVNNNISALYPKMIVEELEMQPPTSSLTLPRTAKGSIVLG